MYTKLISIALLAASAAAAADGGKAPEDDAILIINTGGAATADKISQFLTYENQYGKSYRTTTQQSKAYQNYMKADKLIEEVNEAAKLDPNPDAAKAKHNFFSDMDEEDIEMFTGLNEMSAAQILPPVSDEYSGGQGGRSAGGRQAITPVNHYTDGFMHPIKDQKNCGSCYAFAANTALEGQIRKIKNQKQDKNDLFRLSEQEIVDCSGDYGNQGCNGGLELFSWRYIADKGIKLYKDYSYNAKMGNCQRDYTVKPKEKSYGVLGWSGWLSAPDNPVDRLKEEVQKKPISIALKANCPAFMYYGGGIITEKQCPPARIDHAVVLVGWHAPSPDSGTGADACINTKWYSNCPNDDNSGNYWIIQNSWGAGWGEDGFAKIEMAAGNGVSNMNTQVTWPVVNPLLIDVDP